MLCSSQQKHREWYSHLVLPALLSSPAPELQGNLLKGWCRSCGLIFNIITRGSLKNNKKEMDIAGTGEGHSACAWFKQLVSSDPEEQQHAFFFLIISPFQIGSRFISWSDEWGSSQQRDYFWLRIEDLAWTKFFLSQPHCRAVLCQCTLPCCPQLPSNCCRSAPVLHGKKKFYPWKSLFSLAFLMCKHLGVPSSLRAWCLKAILFSLILGILKPGLPLNLLGPLLLTLCQSSLRGPCQSAWFSGQPPNTSTRVCHA